MHATQLFVGTIVAIMAWISAAAAADCAHAHSTNKARAEGTAGNLGLLCGGTNCAFATLPQLAGEILVSGNDFKGGHQGSVTLRGDGDCQGLKANDYTDFFHATQGGCRMPLPAGFGYKSTFDIVCYYGT